MVNKTVLEWLGSLIPLKFLDTQHDHSVGCGHSIVSYMWQFSVLHTCCHNSILFNAWPFIWQFAILIPAGWSSNSSVPQGGSLICF